MNSFQNDIDTLRNVNTVDLEALQDAQFTLQAIKDADSGVYDEIIDESLRLIAIALNTSCDEAIERIANQLGASA
jgi:hypothetical protein